MQNFLWIVNYSSVYFCNLSAVALIDSINDVTAVILQHFFLVSISFAASGCDHGELMIMMCKWLLFKRKVWNYASALNMFSIFMMVCHSQLRPKSDSHWAHLSVEIYAPENVKFVLLFARGFSLFRHEDTHLNEIVLLFNGDVNYSAVKTSPEIYSNLERVA